MYAPLENGYHPIFSIFQKISLFDTLTIEKTLEKTVSIDSNFSELEQNNILQKVYNYFENKLSCGFNIQIQKSIPLGSGMGGGSSNAATFLNVLHHHYSISKENILSCAKTLGSDITFFLDTEIAKVSGCGEIIHKLPSIIYPAFILIVPNLSSETQAVYNKFDSLNKFRIQNKELENELESNHIGPNDLKESVWSTHTDYKFIENKVNALNIGTLQLSGSGSTMFIPLQETKNIAEIKTRLSKCLPSCKIIEAYAIQDNQFSPNLS